MPSSTSAITSPPTYILAGRLQRDFLLPHRGRPLIDVPGGSLLYTAAGLGVWSSLGSGRERLVKGRKAPHETILGLLARVGEDYPQAWLRTFEKRGWDTRGIHILAEVLDLRYFQATLPDQSVQRTNPIPHFARLGLTFPKSLLGYQPPAEPDAGHPAVLPDSPHPSDIPPDYLYARAAHLCPTDYLTACRLTSSFRAAGINTLTLAPSSSIMTVGNYPQVRVLLQGLTAFLPSEKQLRALFWGQTNDLWEMTTALGDYGCEFIIVKRGARGQMLYDSVAKKRWELPAYPSEVTDLNGAGDSFCGGFLTGYQQSYDPVRGVLQGSVSASLSIEGSGAFHALDALPGLAQRRLDSLAGSVRQV